MNLAQASRLRRTTSSVTGLTLRSLCNLQRRLDTFQRRVGMRNRPAALDICRSTCTGLACSCTHTRISPMQRAAVAFLLRLRLPGGLEA